MFDVTLLNRYIAVRSMILQLYKNGNKYERLHDPLRQRGSHKRYDVRKITSSQ
jgi:hypothetical protein